MSKEAMIACAWLAVLATSCKSRVTLLAADVHMQRTGEMLSVRPWESRGSVGSIPHSPREHSTAPTHSMLGLVAQQ